MNIKRYDIFPVNHQAGNEIENTDGRYVRFEDASDLQQRLADAERRNAELIELMSEVSKQAGDHHMSHQTWNLKTQLANIHQKLEAALNNPEEAKS
jgi:hypothetical protein